MRTPTQLASGAAASRPIAWTVCSMSPGQGRAADRRPCDCRHHSPDAGGDVTRRHALVAALDGPGCQLRTVDHPPHLEGLRAAALSQRDVQAVDRSTSRGRSAAHLTTPQMAEPEEALCLPDTDWLQHPLTISGPAAELARFRAAAVSAGVMP